MSDLDQDISESDQSNLSDFQDIESKFDQEFEMISENNVSTNAVLQISMSANKIDWNYNFYKN